MKSYALACVSSIVIALSIRKGLSRYTDNMKGAKLVMANSVSTLAASATAGFMNAFIMRRTEMEKGIDIFDPEDTHKSMGKSRSAAKEAVMQTALSRSILALPLLFPGVVFLGLEKARLMPNRFLPKCLVQGLVFFLELYFAVPFGVAYFP